MAALNKVIFKRHDIIFFQGDIEAHFFIIEKGEVSIFTKNKLGEKVFLAQLVEGDIFGEQALIDKSERSATALAQTDCVLLRVSEEGFELMLKDLPVWAASMLKSLSTRLKKMNSLAKQV